MAEELRALGGALRQRGKLQRARLPKADRAEQPAAELVEIASLKRLGEALGGGRYAQLEGKVEGDRSGGSGSGGAVVPAPEGAAALLRAALGADASRFLSLLYERPVSQVHSAGDELCRSLAKRISARYAGYHPCSCRTSARASSTPAFKITTSPQPLH